MFLSLFPEIHKEIREIAETLDRELEIPNPVEEAIIEYASDGEWHIDKESMHIVDRLWLISNRKLSILVRDIINELKLEGVIVKVIPSGDGVTLKPATLEDWSQMTQAIKEFLTKKRQR